MDNSQETQYIRYCRDVSILGEEIWSHREPIGALLTPARYMDYTIADGRERATRVVPPVVELSAAFLIQQQN